MRIPLVVSFLVLLTTLAAPSLAGFADFTNEATDCISVAVFDWYDHRLSPLADPLPFIPAHFRSSDGDYYPDIVTTDAKNRIRVWQNPAGVMPTAGTPWRSYLIPLASPNSNTAFNRGLSYGHFLKNASAWNGTLYGISTDTSFTLSSAQTFTLPLS